MSTQRKKESILEKVHNDFFLILFNFFRYGCCHFLFELSDRKKPAQNSI